MTQLEGQDVSVAAQSELETMDPARGACHSEGPRPPVDLVGVSRSTLADVSELPPPPPLPPPLPPNSGKFPAREARRKIFSGWSQDFGEFPPNVFAKTFFWGLRRRDPPPPPPLE